MIQAVIFDLDGTLVQTEKLKAFSYARALTVLCPNELDEDEVVEAFREVVGRSRQEVAEFLLTRFGLEENARKRLGNFGVSASWEVLVTIRLGIYEGMLADEAMLREHRWPHNVALLHEAQAHGCATTLATMSYWEQVGRILRVLDLESAFNTVTTKDDVTNGKPDPEIYLLTAHDLGFTPEQCLVIEDSPAGAAAALAAGMQVLAVSTPFTKDGLRQVEGLQAQHIVDDPDMLPEVVKRTFEAQSSAAQWI